MGLEGSEILVQEMPDHHLVMRLIREREELHHLLEQGAIQFQRAKKGDAVNVVRIYRIGDQQYVHKESDLPQNIISETNGTKLCRLAGINAPEVIFSDEKGVLETFIDGVPLNSPDLTEEVIHEGCADLGRVFRQLHSKKVAGFGLFRSENQNEYNTFNEYCRRLKERNLDRANSRPDLFSADQIQKIEALFDHHIESNENPSPVFTHQDIGLQNVHVQGGAVTGLIDFADCQGSLPAADFARLYVQQQLQPEKPPYFNWVAEGYGDINQEQLHLFAVVILIKYMISDPLKVGTSTISSALDQVLGINS